MRAIGKADILVSDTCVPHDPDINHLDNTQVLAPGHYSVKSQSSCVTYFVDAEGASCSCPSFPHISWCKHLAATTMQYETEIPESSIHVLSMHPRPDRVTSAPLVPDHSIVKLERKICRFLARAAVTTDPIDSSIILKLHAALDDVLEWMTDIAVLPAAVAIPPHIKFSTELAAILPHYKRQKPRKNPANN